MLRRILAVVLGTVICQISLIVCLLLAVGLLLALPAQPVLALSGVVFLLLLPGVFGGALAGFLTDRFGWFYGGLTTTFVGEFILLVKVLVVPKVVDVPPSQDLPVWLYLAFLSLLGFCGIAGGWLGHRGRALNPQALLRPMSRTIR